MPPHLDQLGRQLARAGGVDDVRVLPLERGDLGQPALVTLAGAGEVVEAMHDRSHVPFDVVEAIDACRQHETGVDEPAEVGVGVVDRGPQRRRMQPGQTVARLRRRRDHTRRLVQAVRGKAWSGVAYRSPQRLEVGLGPGQRSVVGHHPVDRSSHAVTAHLAEIDVAGGDREPVGVVELAHDRRCLPAPGPGIGSAPAPGRQRPPR